MLKKLSGKRSAIIRRCILIVLGLILGINVYLANARGLGGNQMPMPFGTGMAVVLSGSMEPTLKINDVILVRESQNYQVGDIVVYQSGNMLVVHRITEMSEGTVVTKGDANNAADEPMAISSIKGIMKMRIPVLGIVVKLLRTPVGTIVLLLGAFLLIEGSFRKEKDADDEQLEAIKEEIRKLKELQENKQSKEEE